MIGIGITYGREASENVFLLSFLFNVAKSAVNTM